jgi:hypothetical protein
MATPVERKFVVLLLLLAITGTRRYEIVKKKSQLKGPKRQGKEKLVRSADEGKVESSPDHLCTNDVDFFFFQNPHRLPPSFHPPSSLSLHRPIRSRIQRMLRPLTDRTPIITAKPAVPPRVAVG